jgi:hypothetical protein
MTTQEKKQANKEAAKKANELAKTCPKEQAKIRKQLIKLGIYF